MVTRIYFVRHGESESNLIHQFAGSLDKPLTDKGRCQANATASFLSDVPFAAVYASDLARAYETGKQIANLHSIPLISDVRLREIYAGEWEGKIYSDLEKEYPDSYGVWLSQIGLTQCPAGESVASLQMRVHECINEIVRKHPGETVCVATHATPIRVMECVWSQTPLSQMHTIPWVGNASVTIVEYNGDGKVQVLQRDLTDHLGDLKTVLAKNV